MSEIEGEVPGQVVRSRLRADYGMDIGALTTCRRNVEGVVEMILDATQEFAEPLTVERLFGWHASLFPTGRSGMIKIKVGAWRDNTTGPMQVVSGPIGRQRVHYEAPAADRLDARDEGISRMVQQRDEATAFVLKAGVANLWFVTLHPFDDGNGRIARAIADLTLARSEKNPQRFYTRRFQRCATSPESDQALNRRDRIAAAPARWASFVDSGCSLT